MRQKYPETVKAGTAGTGEKKNLISHMSLRHRRGDQWEAIPQPVLRLNGWPSCMDEGLNLQNRCAGSRAFGTGPTAAKVVSHQDFLLCLDVMAERWPVSLRKQVTVDAWLALTSLLASSPQICT